MIAVIRFVRVAELGKHIRVSETPWRFIELAIVPIPVGYNNDEGAPIVPAND